MSIKKSSSTPPPPPPSPSVHDLEDLLDWQQQLSLEDTVFEPFFLPPNQKIVAVLQNVDGKKFLRNSLISFNIFILNQTKSFQISNNAASRYDYHVNSW